MQKQGFRIVSGGTDTHLMLVDVTVKGFKGKEVQELLDVANITVNKNMIPFDAESPFVTSGIRLGTPSVTTRGMREPEMVEIAAIIAQALQAPKDQTNLEQLRKRVKTLTDRFPIYPELRNQLRAQ